MPDDNKKHVTTIQSGGIPFAPFLCVDNVNHDSPTIGMKAVSRAFF